MWWLVWGGAGLLGMLAGLVASSAGLVLPLAISVGAIGALVGVGCRLSFESLPEADFGRALLRSAGLGAIVALGIVLPFIALGRVWFAGVFLLGVTSPPSRRWCRRRLRRAVLLARPPDEAELWAAWELSGRALEHPLSGADATVLVEVRQQVLDELMARHGGIPEQLWSVGHAPPESGARRTGRG